MKAYEVAIRATAAEHAPWYVVPADNKWFTRLVVATAIVETQIAFIVVSSQFVRRLFRSSAGVGLVLAAADL